MPVKPVPDGFHTVTPYLVVKGASELVEFLKDAFGAEVTECMRRPDGTIGHASARIGDSMIMLAEATAQHGPMPCSIYLYVPDTEALYQRALKAGATSIMEPADQFYGDRNAGVMGPGGVQWWIGTHVEDVPHDELERRAATAMKKGH